MFQIKAMQPLLQRRNTMHVSIACRLCIMLYNFTYNWAGTGKSATSPVPGITISGGVGKAVQLGTSNAPGSTFELPDDFAA